MESLDVMGLLKAVQDIQRDMSVALMYSGLRIPHFRLLDELEGVGQATVTEMSTRLRITRATASVMINELIRSGVLMTVENPADRRSFYVALTQAGKYKLQVARSDFMVFLDNLSKRYAPETLRALNDFAGMSQ